MEEYEAEGHKKKVLHIANKNALMGGIGTVIDYLKEGTNKSEGFQADSLLTTYDQSRHVPGRTTLAKGSGKEEEEVSEGELESLIENYDVIHVHGIPHYGIIEKLQKIKGKEGKKPKIVNTAHSSVKQEFLAQYEKASNSTEKEMVDDFKELKFYIENGILENPAKFADTYWGSAIYRQEQIMTMSDSVQHMNEAYKDEILKEYSAQENSEKHVVIPNGVRLVEEYKDRPRKKRILFVGRFAQDKGIDELTDALPMIFEKNPDAEIRLVGGDESGRLVERYRKKTERAMRQYFKDKPGHDVEKYLLRIEFTGWEKDPMKIQEHYRWTDYVIVPSRAESFSLTASEALMHKRIPIVTRTKALDDLYVSKGIAFGIEPEERHGEGIANRVNEILLESDSKKHDEMAEMGRKFAAENYSFERMIAMQLESYKDLLETKKKKKGQTNEQNNEQMSEQTIEQKTKDNDSQPDDNPANPDTTA